MGGEPIPGPHDMLVLWFRLSSLEGKERQEAIEKLENWADRRLHGNNKGGNIK